MEKKIKICKFIIYVRLKNLNFNLYWFINIYIFRKIDSKDKNIKVV